MRKLYIYLVAGAAIYSTLIFVGCESGNDGVYPAFRDDNGNAINDYVEQYAHMVSSDDPRQHEYVDNNGNQVCDQAESGDPAWHGPGYIDENGNGKCDYWDQSSPRYQEGHRDMVYGSDFGDDHGAAGE